MKAATKKPAAKKGSAAKTLDQLGVEWLCDQITDGCTQTEICKKLKVAMGSLSRWIALDAERSARVREARIAAARAYDDRATDGIRVAKNAFQLAKAKELAHHYRWKASKADPRHFGEKLQVDQTTSIVNLSDEEITRRRSELRAMLDVAASVRSESAPPAP